MQSTLAAIVAELRSRFDDKDVELDTGYTSLSEKKGPRRIVFVRKGGDIQPIRTTAGPIRFRHLGRIVQFYRSYDDVMQVEAHIVANSEAELEVFQRKLLNAAKSAFGTCSQPGSYAMVTEADKAGLIHGGKAYAVQLFAWRVTIARERTHQLGDEARAEISPKIPVTELVEINGIQTTYRLEAAAGNTLGTSFTTTQTPTS